MRQLISSFLLLIFFSFTAKGQLQFIENGGQWHKEVHFKANIFAGEVFMEQDGMRFLLYDDKRIEELHGHQLPTDSSLDCHAFKIKFLGANPSAQLQGRQPSSTKYNYFLGNDSRKWTSNKSAFKTIYYHNLYEGIDLEVFSIGGHLKYNFILTPFADPNQIKIAYLGVEDMWLEDGKLFTMTSLRKIWENEPYSIQQQKNGNAKKVATSFKLDGNIVTFSIDEEYRFDQQLLIDPTLVFGTFSGSTADNFGFTGTYDQDGNSYSGGTVYAFGFPVTLGAFQISWQGGVVVDNSIGDIPRDIGILKYNDDGTQLIYVTHLGGAHNEDPHSMVVNEAGELLIFGNTGSKDFPTTINAYDTSYNGNFDIFVAKLSSDGTRLLSSTFVGGSGRDGLNGRQTVINRRSTNTSPLGYNYGDMYRGEIITDANNLVYVVSSTRSSDFPTTNGAFQNSIAGEHDMCLIKLNSDLSQLLASTYFGGKEQDAGFGIALDSKNNIYVCGGTQSTDLPVPTTAFQSSFQGLPADGIIAHFSNNFDSLLNATYYGTDKYDQTYFVQLDRDNNVYVTGQTTNDNFVVKDVTYYQANGKQFISKFSPALDSLIYATKFGSGRAVPDVAPSAFLVDVCERVYFSGWGGRANFNGDAGGLDITADNVKAQTDSSDFYLAVFSRNIDSLIYGSYFGGDTSEEHVDGGTSRFSKQGIVYQSVCGGCGGGFSDFPTTSGAVSETNNAATGNLCNNAFFKIHFELPILIADLDIPELLCNEDEIEPINRSVGATQYKWFFGDGTTSTEESPKHKYQDTGVFEVVLVVSNPITCNATDTLKKQVRVYTKADASLDFVQDQCGYRAYFNYTGKRAFRHEWQWADTLITGLKGFEHRFDTAGTYAIRLIADKGSSCADTAVKLLNITPTQVDFRYLTDSCETRVRFREEVSGAFSFKWKRNTQVFSFDEDPSYTFEKEGNYPITLVINAGTYCSDSITKIVQVNTIDRKEKIGIYIDSCLFKVQLWNASQIQNGTLWRMGSTILRDDTFNFTINGGGYRAIEMVVDPFSACPDTAFEAIELKPIPKADFLYTKDSCTTQVDFFNTSSQANTYQWLIEDRVYNRRNVSHSFSDSGIYMVKLIAQPFSACADTIAMNVEMKNARFALFDILIDTCLLTVDITNSSQQVSNYLWDFGNGTTSEIKNPSTLTYQNAGNFTILLVTDLNDEKCMDSFKINFDIYPLPKAGFERTIGVCPSDWLIYSEAQNAEETQWQLNDDNLLEGDSLVFNITNPKTYTLKQLVISEVGCKDSLQKIYEMDSLPKADFIFQLDSCTGDAQFEAIGNDFQSYKWYLAEDAINNERKFNYTFNLNKTVNKDLSLVVNAGTNCQDSVHKIVEIKEISSDLLKIPNVISPNGDGKNDVFKVEGLFSHCNEMHLEVYNRWGVKIYETNEKPLIWDAFNDNQKPFPPSAYFYLLNYEGQTIKGIITIVK